MLRAMRQWLTRRVTGAALASAPRISTRTVDAIEGLLATCGPYCPVIRRIVADNMRSLGVYSKDAHRDYFARAGAHFAGQLHALRQAGVGEGRRVCDGPADVVAERFELDASVARLTHAAAEGTGAIVMAAHAADFLRGMARLNQTVPLTAYYRYSRDPRRREAKERIFRALGIAWISEPAGASGSLGRLGRMARAVREGGTLYFMADLARKRSEGVAVQWLGREVYLPAAPALLALRTGAPLFMLLAEPNGPGQRLTIHGPYVPPPAARTRADRRAAVADRMQWFASGFERFLLDQPGLWFFWGDKRWTRVCRGDPRYTRSVDPSPAAPIVSPPTGVLSEV